MSIEVLESLDAAPKGEALLEAPDNPLEESILESML
jgi:hypothetical protein